MPDSKQAERLLLPFDAKQAERLLLSLDAKPGELPPPPRLLASIHPIPSPFSIAAARHTPLEEERRGETRAALSFPARPRHRLLPSKLH